LVGYKPQETCDCTQSGVLEDFEFVTVEFGYVRSPYRTGINFEWSQISFINESFDINGKGTVIGNYWVEVVSGHF
jgi:hypothetical protein